MPSLNFEKQFAADVESGKKRQTIRAKRKHHIVSGDRLYLFTGMRTTSCRRLGEYPARLVRDIVITETAVKVDGQALYQRSVIELAKADGFDSIDALRDFFRSRHGLPFRGDLITW